MTLGFRRTWTGEVQIDLDADEAAVLRSMAQLVLSLVDAPEQTDDLAGMVGIGAERDAPEDPVLARLFPDAYGDDEEAAGEFRRFTEDSLRAGKRADAEAVLKQIPESGGRVRIPGDDAAGAWLRSLNDVRLALGTRLGIQEDGWHAEPANDEEGAALGIYDWLTGLQESLVQSLR